MSRALPRALVYRSAVERDGEHEDARTDRAIRYAAIRRALATLGLTEEAKPELTQGYAKRLEHTEAKIERLVEALPKGAVAVLTWDPRESRLTFWPSMTALEIDGDGDDLRPVFLFSLAQDYEPIQDPAWDPSSLRWDVPERFQGATLEVAYADPTSEAPADRGAIFKRITNTVTPEGAPNRVRYYRRRTIDL